MRDNFPQSFLAGRLRAWSRAYLDPVAGTLTPAQGDVLRRLLEGQSLVTIANETGRAYGTVRKHLQNIHEAFETHSYGELFIECFRRGIVSRPAAPAVQVALPDVG